jgi:hypothetical protein
MGPGGQNVVTEADFEESLALKQTAMCPAVSRVAPERLAQVIGDLAGGAEALSAGPVVEWTARSPYDATLGQIYAFHASRWDTVVDLVYMYPMRQTGSGLGEFDGTVVYADFNAPSAGSYLIVAHYAGENTTIRLRGPWGTVVRSMPAGSNADVVSATWTGSGALHFTLTFQGVWLGYLASVQVFKIS